MVETLTMTGNTSVIQSNYFPEIDLSEHEYELALLLFETYNAVPNVDDYNNNFTFSVKGHGTMYTISIPTGAYEINQLEDYIVKQMKEEIRINKIDYTKLDPKIRTDVKELDEVKDKLFVLRTNEQTMKCEMWSQFYIHFDKSHSIRKLLGFEKQVYDKFNWHTSQAPTDINKINIIRIETNITKGAYADGKPVHIIHEFSGTNEIGYKITEVPKNLIYFPVTVRSLSNLTVRITDQNNRLIDFRRETITIRLHIRKKRNDAYI